eukprot:scaffold12174_cov66-Cylindrotheca_fusiformis.AAC.2
MAEDYLREQWSRNPHLLPPSYDSLSPEIELVVLPDIDNHLHTMSRSLDYYAPLREHLNTIKYAESRTSLSEDDGI